MSNRRGCKTGANIYPENVRHRSSYTENIDLHGKNSDSGSRRPSVEHRSGRGEKNNILLQSNECQGP
jgi:hypothetical protein